MWSGVDHFCAVLILIIRSVAYVDGETICASICTEKCYTEP